EKKYVVTYSSAVGKLSINYVYEDGKQAFESYSQQLENGASYEVISPSINGYAPDLSIVSGTMDTNGEVHTVTYSPNTYTVTFDPNGGSISNIESTKTVEYDSIYGQLPTPVKLGYTFEGWKLNDQWIDSNTVVKITEDTTLTASWKGLSFTVAIKYVSEEGEELRPSTINSHEIGTDYSYTSPQIEGYNCETPIVSGKMPAQNVVVIVLYTKVKYTVTIYFTCSDSNVELPETIVEEYKHGESYSITVPTISGYTPTLNVVSGVINADNVEVTVHYYESVDDITITWGTMDFEYNKGIWNPQTHTYSNGSFAPINNSNTVTITNNGSSTFNVNLLYYASSQYPTISGRYTSDEGGTSTITSVSINGSNTVTVYFHISDPDNGLGGIALPNNFSPGNCSASIIEVSQ
ncbi:MAG: InlB B-repeat-containing protein, partial [Erysipelotrichales bacterium]|nr:InlB B-repeat-containing protein [Erysipelotrichales bacterium]